MIDNYQELLDTLTDSRIEFIVEHLPYFREHALLVNESGEAVYVDLESEDDIVPMDELTDFVSEQCEMFNAIGVTLATRTTVVDVDKDDPYYEDYLAGVLDIDSIPDHMKKSSISVYTEVLGPHRRNAVLKLSEDFKNISDDIIYCDPRMWKWFPLIATNDRSN